jgi:hypothetical protein
MAKCDVLDHSLLLNDLNELNYVKIITDHIANFFTLLKPFKPCYF